MTPVMIQRFPSQDNCDIEHQIVRSRPVKVFSENQSWRRMKQLMSLIYHPEVTVMKLN
ncbi:MAG: hypothetical protein RID53_15845 [Coleofasciculus sp. B1-GNL1-01]|uniref:hypothetical protein n=1 Tax=Coleofasciculus sp. B1-GNL1-01 TaxID=3068484 RepID=UPI0032F2266C